MKKWFVVAGLLLAVMMLAGACVSIDAGSVEGPAPSMEAPPDVKLSIISQEMTRDESGIPRLQAKIKNVGTDTVGLVEATVEFLDGSGNLIDSSVDTTTDLEPHQTWDCVITCSGEGCERAVKSEIHVTGSTTERRQIDMGWK